MTFSWVLARRDAARKASHCAGAGRGSPVDGLDGVLARLPHLGELFLDLLGTLEG